MCVCVYVSELGEGGGDIEKSERIKSSAITSFGRMALESFSLHPSIALHYI